MAKVNQRKEYRLSIIGIEQFPLRAQGSRFYLFWPNAVITLTTMANNDMKCFAGGGGVRQ